MKLLIVTQAVDSADPILGFFVRWIEEIAARVERVEVICLRRGADSLPDTVRVHSLGGENGRRPRLITALRFKWHAWKLRHAYDTVLVHMNPEYLLVAGPLWRVLGKKIAFWYNHPKGGARLMIASFFAHRVFYTSPHAATAPFKKSKRMPVGIDTWQFAPRRVQRHRQTIYMQGRVMPSKRVHVALEALRLLRTHLPATLTIVGPEDPEYGKDLRARFADLFRDGAAVFLGPKRNTDTPELYASCGAALNLAGSGHFDKSVFEAMACETPVIVGGAGYEDLVPRAWVVPQDDAAALSKTLAAMLELPESAYAALGAVERSAVVEHHSLARLADELERELSHL